MCRWRHKIVFLILIISTWCILATGQYEKDIRQIKCCDDDDKSDGNSISSSSSSSSSNNISTKSVELSLVLDRYRFNEAISKPSSSCIRISFESLLTDTRIQSLSALKIDANKNVGQSSNNANEMGNHQYVVYCNNTSIDDFISVSIGDKSVASLDGPSSHSHSNSIRDEMLSGIILLNVPLNGADINNNPIVKWQQTAAATTTTDVNIHRNQLTNATEYMSWTKSHLSSELFSSWMRTIQPAFNHLTHLDLSDNDITHLTADMFVHFPNVQSLNLSRNAISNATFHQPLFHRFTQLQHLDLSNNKIMSIVYERLHESAPVSNEDDEDNVDVNSSNHDRQSTGSAIRMPVFTNMDELRVLILSHNQIIDLPRNTFTVNGLPKLHYLNLAHNNLSIIPFQIFQPLYALHELDLSSNRLVNFLDNFFIENTALTVLNVRNNMMEKVLKNSFQGLHQLIDLDLSDNQIISIDRNAFDSLEALQRLNLYRNNLTVLPTTLFHQLHQLKYLNLSRNKFKVLPNGIFASQFALEHLIIDETGVQKLNNWVSRKPDDVNKDVLKHLRVISMQNNRNLSEIDAVTLRSLPAVEYLNLSGNRLVILPHEISEMTELKHLDISKNDLISIPRQLNTLEHLDTINMLGNRYECDCQMVWLTTWINDTRKRAINSTLIVQRPPFNQLNQLKCRHGYPGDFLRVLQQLQCFKPTAVHVSESKTYLLRSDAQLECSFSGNPIPDIIWVTPLNKIIRYYADPDMKPLALTQNRSIMNSSRSSNDDQINADLDHQAKNREKMEHQMLKHNFDRFTAPIGINEVTLLENGSLRVHNISRKDSGLYICYAYNVMGYKSAEIR